MKEVEYDNVFDEFFKSVFMVDMMSENFIRATKIFDKNAKIQITNVYTDLEEKFLSRNYEQDISILANIQDIVMIDTNITLKNASQNVIFMIEVQAKMDTNRYKRLVK